MGRFMSYIIEFPIAVALTSVPLPSRMQPNELASSEILTVLEGFRNGMIANFCPLFQLRFDSKEPGKKLFYRDKMEGGREGKIADLLLI
ncbi:hypothetical protein RHMOL_Rhmol01G0002200 [Rhododendron molle]|uniref:Uncharacterized protein n=1 Tax=Rhododendron molle TaxID=49168 RepID=A0ACC0PWB4_RHOML|nr:hypothetical protein RHMOL_Rhmol01G0002200 [Rhododendron molle]